MLIALKKYITGMSARAQKGQIIVFTAFLLPLLIAATGFTVDFGNMYMHKARLQNAAHIILFITIVPHFQGLPLYADSLIVIEL